MKKLVKWPVYIVVIGTALVFSLIGRIDRKSLHKQSFYREMMEALDTLKLVNRPPTQKLAIGWGKYNITPAFDMPMAGYKPRYHFDAVHDSLYARILAIDNGSTIFIISLDLLLFPPVIKEKIERETKKLWPDVFIYLSATHTHNGVGGWNDSPAGKIIAGDYQEEWVHHISEGIVESLKKTKQQMVPGSISYFETDATGYAANRLAGETGKVDSKIRGLKFVRDDSTKAILASFSAHATNISKKSRSLSGDYPAELVTELEKNGYDFAMFMAGMVGSHRLSGFTEQDFELTAKAGKTLAVKILNESVDSKQMDSVSIITAHIPVQHGSSQLRIEKNWRLRDWVFRSLLEPLKGEITLLEIGDILLLGTSCDFSGELSVNAKLDEFALSQKKKLIITSFNGNYTGYITFDDHYDQLKKEEVMAMNWIGPYFGKYYEEIIKRILSKD
ncbi:MAG: neutral/alkaline non-lysosomal ceramidase N-terminal domain-containing protein [Bacteroidota bacterium]